MAVTDTAYSARFELPDLIERGRLNTLRCRVYRSGALAAPSSGMVSVYDSSNTAIVDGASVTVSGSMATYALAGATTSSLSTGEGWRVEWTLVMPDTLTHYFRNDAALVRARFYSPITEADLYRVASSLDPSGAACIHSETSFDSKIDEATIQIEQRLIAEGNRPNLIMSPSAFREPAIYLTLALIFEDFSTRLNAGYAEVAKGYREQFRQWWTGRRFLYDSGDSGVADDPSRRRGGPRSLWLGGTPSPGLSGVRWGQ